MNDGVDIDRSFSALRDAGLTPPVIGLHVVDHDGHQVIIVDVLAPLDDHTAARVGHVLGSTPYKIQEVLFTENGRRPGVSYQHPGW